MGAGHRDAEQKALLCGVDEGPNMTELEEAQEEVREAFCVACAGCSEDMRNMEDGCEGFKKDVKETLLNRGPFGVRA